MDSLLSSKCLVYGCIQVVSSGEILDFVSQLRCARSVFRALLTMNG